jgi:hypothetical protein
MSYPTLANWRILLVTMRRRLLILGVLLAVASSTLGWRLTGGESREPEIVVLTVYIPVSQIQGEFVVAMLGGKPILDCDQLVNLFSLHLYTGAPAGALPCHLNVGIGP